MNFRKVLALVRKEFKKTTREPAILFLTILFPIMLTLAFGLSFGAVGGTQQDTFQIGLINMDNGSSQNWAQSFISNLTSTQVLKVNIYSENHTAQFDLQQGRLKAVLVIPEGFSEACSVLKVSSISTSKWKNVSIPLYLDRGSIIATQAIPPIIQQALSTTVYGPQQNIAVQPIRLDLSMVEVSKQTAFDYMAPGLFAYASIFLTMTVAGSFTGDRENGLLRRISTTPLTATEFMISQVFSNMGLGLIQAIIIFAMAYTVGFRPQVEAGNIIVAFLIMLTFSLCNVGFGLITATIAKSSNAATGIAFIFILPQMFLGTFVGAALSPTAQAIGRLVPSYYVTDAITSLLLRKAHFSSPTVLLDFGIIIASSIMVLAFGILSFKRYGKA